MKEINNGLLIDLNGKEVELNFGIGFVRELDKKFYMEQSGMKFGIGVTKAVILLQTYDVVTAYEVVQSASGKVNVSEKAFEDYLNNNDLSELCDSLLKALSNAPTTKHATSQALAQTTEQ